MINNRDEQAAEVAPTAPHKAFIDTGATGHRIMDVLVATSKAISSAIGIAADDYGTMKATARDKSGIGLSGREEPVILNGLLYVPDVERSFAYVQGLRCDGHTVTFMSKKCVVKERNFNVGLSEHVEGIHSLNLQRANNKATVTPVVTGDMVRVWYASLTHTDRNAVKTMTQGGSDSSLER